MRMQLKSIRRALLASLAAVNLMAVPDLASAAVWNVAGSGDFNIAGNWTGGVPNGSAAIADFSQVDLPGDASVDLDTPVTLGQLLFGDTGLGSAATWELRTNISPLPVITLDNGANKPVIYVGQLTPTTFDDAFIAHSLAGTNGFNKTGPGIATLGQGTANTINGGININQGTLRIAAAIPAISNTVTIANGATIEPRVSLNAVDTRIFSVPSGATANISIVNSVEVGRFDAAGANLNVNFPAATAAGARFIPSGNWLASGAANNPASIVFNSLGPAPTPLLSPSVSLAVPQTGASVRLAPNLSNASSGIRNFNANTFATSNVTINNTLVMARTNSGGNTFNFGSLSGDATAILSGGGQGAHATYSVGALNSNTTFAGRIDMATATGDEATGADTGGLNLTKVGTGTLTLSGTLAYQPTSRANVAQRGGITTISAGTLKLTNSAAIPGGIVSPTPAIGTVLSTVNIAGGATLDVSGYTAGTYSTASLQQVVGAGTVVGNYAHPAGVIRPGNTINGTTASGTSPSVPTAGTMTFQDNFTWSGGDYTYDMTLNPSVGNDSIFVGGTATLTSGSVTPNFLAGIPTTGTYTLMTAAAFSGSASNITVNWPGRLADPVPFIVGNTLRVTSPGLSSANLTWVGNNGPAWDIETTGNWSGASPNTFFQSDSVTFNDTASTYAVTLNANVQPTSVTVNNTTNAYTISGSGSIGGSSTFTKTGSGLLTMTTANLFSGAASVTGGTVDIGSAGGALGTGPLTLSNTQLNSNNTANTGMTNSLMTIPAGTTSTIKANGQTSATVAATWAVPALAGDGTLQITSDTVGKIVDFSSAANTFTGVLNLVGATDIDGVEPLVTVNTTVYRMNAATSSMPNAEVNLTNGASLRDRATSVQTLTLGALSGDATATLYGYQGGSGATARTWVIGGLNLNTTFAGVIQNSAGSNSTTAPVTLNKVGTGELELTGVNTYTGNTNVNQGTLSISNPFLADLADVSVSTGATLDLNFGSLATIDTIDSLFFNGISQAAGTWGRIGSGANFEASWLTGDGLLNVVTFVPPTNTPGDFDLDGDVDGRDFLIWQRGGSPGGAGNATDLGNWQTNYGTGVLSDLTAATTAVPEPAGIVLVAMAGLFVAGRRRS
jgi:fibronectin-binding autotransporter adhesin